MSRVVPLGIRLHNSLILKPSSALHRMMPITVEHKYGHIQTGGTCWFNSIINPFLESKYGRKLLLKKLREYYFSLIVLKKIEFMNPKVIGKTKKFKFFKFVYTYWTNKRLSKQSGRNRNLVMNRNNGYYKMCMGSHPMREIDNILKTIGITNNDVHIEHYDREAVETTRNSGNKVLDSCILHMTYMNGSAHAICGIITPDGKYMLIDSNGGNFECDWRQMISLFPCLKKHYPTIKDVFYDSVIYVKTLGLPRNFSTNIQIRD
jgi:hypothetical protein